MTWFTSLTGVEKESREVVHEQIRIEGQQLISSVNGRSYQWGRLETPSLSELRERVQNVKAASGRMSVREVVANVQDLHSNRENAGALFQVASQFNLLEMVSSRVTPEEGVGRYEQDGTQGPACAIACGAGTIYRNYFVPLNGQLGQTRKNQIDCIADLGKALGNEGNSLWTMQNGYLLPSLGGLEKISTKLRSMSTEEKDTMRGKLRIGIQWDTQVTLGTAGHKVTQVYGSALPITESKFPVVMWEEIGRIVLEASYEATICTTLLNQIGSGNKTAYLTFLGGGAFGNPMNWITDAIKRALDLYRGKDLDVAFVSYRESKPHARELVKSYSGA